MFGVPSILAGLAQAQLNAMSRLLPPIELSVITNDLIDQGERTVCRLAFWTALLPDWLEPVLITKMLRRLDAITDQLEHFASLNR